MQTGYLLEHTQLEAGELIKLQGVKTKIVTPYFYIRDVDSTECVPPSTSVEPKEIAFFNTDEDICEDATINNYNDVNKVNVQVYDTESGAGVQCDELLEGAK